LFVQAHGGANTPHATAMLFTGRRDYEADEWKVTIKNSKHSILEAFPNFHIMSANKIPVRLALEAGGDPEKCIEHTVPANILTRDAVQDIRKLDGEDWFYTVWYMDVHDYLKFDIYKYPLGQEQAVPYIRSDEDIAFNNALNDDYKDIMLYSQYSCAVKYTDMMINRLYSRLTESEIYPDWIIFMADHGEYLKPYYTHGVHWQYQVTRIPLIILGMDKDGNFRTNRNSICSYVDICDLFRANHQECPCRLNPIALQTNRKYLHNYI
jgi:hypothetical protein